MFIVNLYLLHDFQFLLFVSNVANNMNLTKFIIQWLQINYYLIKNSLWINAKVVFIDCQVCANVKYPIFSVTHYVVSHFLAIHQSFHP